MSTREQSLDPDALAAMEEQRDFLLRSLADLEREHDAGDVDAADYAALKDDYTARAAMALRSIDQGHARVAADRPPRGRGRAAVTIAIVVSVAALAGYLVTQSAGRRGAGETVSGDIRTTIRSKLDDAMVLGEQGDLVKAFDLYAAVLKEQPSNVEALAYRGWFIGRAGDLDRGAELIGDALTIDGGYGDAKVFLAYITSTRGDAAKALSLLDEAESETTSAYATVYLKRLRQELQPA
jgi:tetratricopeptide (TPR) repeat protein